jgi:hypothetical protein
MLLISYVINQILITGTAYSAMAPDDIDRRISDDELQPKLQGWRKYRIP